MEDPAESAPHLMDASKRLAQQALVVCENRVHLLLLEAQEEREKLFHAFCLCVGLAVFVLLAGVAVTLLVAVACWELQWSPVAALVILVLIYGGIAALLYAQLLKMWREWESFPATFNELRKDRECLEKNLN